MIDRLGLVGLTFRSGGSRSLARFTLPAENRAAQLEKLSAKIGTEELVYLATCNRVEVAFLSDGSMPLSAYRPRIFAALTGREPQPGEAERTLKAWAGEGAVEHLFMVAAGLDSAQMGEREIRGQLREAVRQARNAEVCGALLQETFDEALKVARRVHRETEIGGGRTSLAEIALDAVRARLGSDAPPVGVVGVSPMTRYCAQMLSGQGGSVVVINRTLERAEELAAEIGARALGLDEFLAAPVSLSALVLATAAATPVLDAATLERLATAAPRRPLLVDMAVPGDVEESAARDLGFELLTMDDIAARADSNRERRHQELAAAREEVDRALDDLRRRLAERWVSPVLASLSRRYQETAQQGVERLMRELGEIGEAEREALSRWAHSLARRFAHIPSVGLRALAYEAGPEAVEAFLQAADGALAGELRDALQSPPKWALEDAEA